MVRKATDSAVS